jgi:hypothetical protein
LFLQRKEGAATFVLSSIRRSVMTIKEEVLSLMEKGKASVKKGWVMSDILKEIEDKHGEKGMNEARDYIIKDYCEIPERDQ